MTQSKKRLSQKSDSVIKMTGLDLVENAETPDLKNFLAELGMSERGAYPTRQKFDRVKKMTQSKK